MNRNELVDAVAERIGDRRTAAAAVDAVLVTVTRTVSAGEKVSLFGFGVFERVERAARTARNPSTGAAVSLPARAVPRFRPGQALKDAVGGTSVQERGAATERAAGALAVAEGEDDISKGAAGKDDRGKAAKGKDEKGKDEKGKAKGKDEKGKDEKGKAKGKGEKRKDEKGKAKGKDGKGKDDTKAAKGKDDTKAAKGKDDSSRATGGRRTTS